MLIERTFALGGWICIGAGLALIVTVVAYVPGAWPSLISSGFLLGFGTLFLYVGRDARRARLALLASPEPVDQSGKALRPRP